MAEMFTQILPAQLVGLIMTSFFTTLLLLCLHYGVIKKQKMGKAPSNKLMVFLEIYYSGFSNLLTKVMANKNNWAHPYLFTLFNFIFINSIIPWLGFEAAPTTLMFTFPLTLISFIIIYVIGIGTMGLWGFIKHKYSNPLEFILQFAPLISMSVRLFAATLAGAVIGNALWVMAAGIAGPNSPITYWFPALMGIWKWGWQIVDTALGLLQAFVFIMLSAIFWTMDTGPSWSAKERKKIKEEKALAAQKELQLKAQKEKVFQESKGNIKTKIKAKGAQNGSK